MYNIYRKMIVFIIAVGLLLRLLYVRLRYGNKAYQKLYLDMSKRITRTATIH